MVEHRVEVTAEVTGLGISQLLIADVELATVVRILHKGTTHLIGADIRCLQDEVLVFLLYRISFGTYLHQGCSQGQFAETTSCCRAFAILGIIFLSSWAGDGFHNIFIGATIIAGTI